MDDPAFRNYWERKRLAQNVPAFPVKRWWRSDGLSEIERLYFEIVAGAPSLLDVGAGSLDVKKKLVAAGFRGEYRTLDPGTEFPHDYRDLSEVKRRFHAILCLDVIEHLPLREGLALIDGMGALLEPGGVLVVQTPNGRCIRSPLSLDMTHVQCYSVQELWAYLTAQGFSVEGYRIVFRSERPGLLERLGSLASAFVITRLLGCDYADNVSVVARRQ